MHINNSSVIASFVSASSLTATVTYRQPFPLKLVDPSCNSLRIWFTECWAPGMEHSCLPAQEPRHPAQQPGLPAVLQSFHNVTQTHSVRVQWSAALWMRPSLFKKFRAGDHLQRGKEEGNAWNTEGICSCNAKIIREIYNMRYECIYISVSAILVVSIHVWLWSNCVSWAVKYILAIV